MKTPPSVVLPRPAWQEKMQFVEPFSSFRLKTKHQHLIRHVWYSPTLLHMVIYNGWVEPYFNMLTATICWPVAERKGEMDDGWIPWLNVLRADKRIANDEADPYTMKLMSIDYHCHHHYCWLCWFWKDRWVATFIITAVYCSCPPRSPPPTFWQWCLCTPPLGR